MRINDELSYPIIVHAATMDWVSSPAAGVDRRMLFRIGGEVARAPSIVRYAPGDGASTILPKKTPASGMIFQTQQ